MKAPVEGDVLERKETVYTEDRPIDSWKLGTVIEVERDRIHLEYEDGSREWVERNARQMRWP